MPSKASNAKIRASVLSKYRKIRKGQLEELFPRDQPGLLRLAAMRMKRIWERRATWVRGMSCTSLVESFKITGINGALETRQPMISDKYRCPRCYVMMESPIWNKFLSSLTRWISDSWSSMPAASSAAMASIYTQPSTMPSSRSGWSKKREIQKLRITLDKRAESMRKRSKWSKCHLEKNCLWCGTRMGVDRSRRTSLWSLSSTLVCRKTITSQSR